jgi:hypothetical protein
MVTGDLGLADTLDLLGHREFVFVIEGNEVAGLITLSDLQRIPVGMAVLAIILATELGLNELIARHYGEWRFMAHLSEDRRRQVLERHEELRRRNLETGPIDALMLEERLTLVGKVQRFRRELGLPSRKRYESWTEELKKVRNVLAMATRSSVTSRTRAGPWSSWAGCVRSRRRCGRWSSEERRATSELRKFQGAVRMDPKGPGQPQRGR